MKEIKNNFVYKYQEKAEEWESCTDGRSVFVNCYKLILSGLDELIEKNIQSVVVLVAFEKHMDELEETMKSILVCMGGK